MLTAKQKRFVDEYSLDSNAAAAARRAGYSHKGAKVTGCRLLTNANLKAAIAAKQAEAAEQLDIRRDDIIGGILSGAALARSRADPGNVIRAYSEICRIMGFYGQPVAKRAVPRAESAAQRAKFDALSDDQLLAIIEGKLPAPQYDELRSKPCAYPTAVTSWRAGISYYRPALLCKKCLI